MQEKERSTTESAVATEAGRDVLTVTDERTGRSYELPLVVGEDKAGINAMDLREIKVSEDDFGVVSYDPGFKNTASTKSSITYLDGENGVLRYRGYPIEELAEEASFLEVAYLVLRGELPDEESLAGFEHDVTHHTFVHENVRRFLDGFRYDAHAMGMMVSTVAALSTFYYDEAQDVESPEARWRQIVRLVAKMPTLAAWCYRHHRGLPYVYPDNELSYTDNFANMLWQIGADYEVDPVVSRALEVLFILHVDHTQNCSANVMRSVGSSHADPYVSLSAAMSALFGPLHGGANERVLRMLDRIGDVENVPDFIESVKNRETLLMGFGHRVYKSYDPRAKIIKDVAHEVFEVTGRNPLLDIALELERIALEDEFFVERNLYPNVDFYSGIIYQAMGFPVEMFPVLFAIPRTVGWLAQWEEMIRDPEQKISRPRQIWTGEDLRHWVPIGKR